MSQPKTNNFMLAAATVMIGPKEDLMKLNPEEHSIGLVKNYTVTNDKTSTDLNAGVQNDLAFTMVTSSDTRSTMEVYEYTAKNMAYALGLAGYEMQEVTGDVYTMTTEGTNNTDKTHTLTVDTPASGQALSDGQYVSIRNPLNDNIVLAKVTDASTLSSGTLTVQVDLGDAVIPKKSVVQAVSILELGSTKEQAELSAKVSGQLADGTWVTVLNPRVKMTSSFSAAFSADNFGNMPFEWRNLKLLMGDTFYSEFKGISGKLAKDSTQSERS